MSPWHSHRPLISTLPVSCFNSTRSHTAHACLLLQEPHATGFVVAGNGSVTQLLHGGACHELPADMKKHAGSIIDLQGRHLMPVRMSCSSFIAALCGYNSARHICIATACWPTPKRRSHTPPGFTLHDPVAACWSMHLIISDTALRACLPTVKMTDEGP
jgi:hypothetical protein